MKLPSLFAPTSAILLFLGVIACQEKKQETSSKMLTQNDFPKPPVAEVIPKVFDEFGAKRTDNYFWIRDPKDQKAIDYINLENAYTDTVMAHTKPLQEKLFDEMKARIKEDDQSVPYKLGDFWYYSRNEAGKQYNIFCRRNGTMEAKEEVMVDFNQVAEGKPTLITGDMDVSPDGRYFAFMYNLTGSYAEWDLYVKDLQTGEILPEVVNSTQQVEWAADSKTFYYTKADAALREYQVYRRQIGNKTPDVLVFEEPNESFNVRIRRSRKGDYIKMMCESFTTADVRLLDAHRPESKPLLFAPRLAGTDYRVEHHKDRFYVLEKDREHLNSRIFEVPLTTHADRKTWKELVPHSSETKIESFHVFEGYLVYLAKTKGLTSIFSRNLATGETKTVSFPEPVYVVTEGTTPEYTATRFRYTYSSMNRPTTTFDYDLVKNESIKLKEQEIPSGFNADNYTVERLWAKAPDGKQVPLAILYKKGLEKNGSNPALLYSYGSYGAPTEANFNANVLSLVDRGFVYALASIRGGDDLGEEWYEDGKLLHKKNTFTDFIACAEHLISQKYTQPSKLAIMGGSAGGLLMGAVVNMRPDLFQAVLGLVPFVDVVSTMQDKSLPLTNQEYEQWGNPSVEADYKYMLSYSPYDNVEKKNYPNILATGGLHDSQVLFHEPTKWVAKLRALKTDSNLVLLHMNMASGHGGASGRFDRLKDMAFYYAFVLDRLGVEERK